MTSSTIDAQSPPAVTLPLTRYLAIMLRRGGYQVKGRWSWGTGVVHATWVIAGCLAFDADGAATPMMFVLPRSEIETIDNWHIFGMCGTGSLDYLIDDVFVPAERAVPFIGLIDGSWGIAERYDAPLYSTPLVPILLFGSVACIPFQHLGPNADLAPDPTGQRSSGIEVLAELRQRGPNVDLPFDPNGMRSSGNDPICVAG